MLTCSKRYTDLPFAHRQWAHSGHCAHIHGHNWTFDITFACSTLEKDTGFVIDFGKLQFLKEWIQKRFDHTLVLNANDPELEHLHHALADMPRKMLANIIAVPDCSCEGLARYVFAHVNEMVQEQSDSRVFVRSVTVEEDLKNRATFTND